MGQLKLYSLVLLLATFSPGVADCPSTTGTGDLHVHESGGGSFDFKGSCNTWFNMFQVQGLSLNAFFSCSTFGLAPEDPRSKGVLAVEGSHITKVAFTIKTTINAKNALLRVIYDENLQPRVFGTVDGGEMLDMVITKDLGPMKTDDLTIQMSDSSFSVVNSKWKFVITPGTFRLVSGERRMRFDVAVVALKDSRDSPCAAHGVIGQGLDGIHIEGKKDDYVPGADGIFVTSAQGEGSIQGKFADYIVGGPFETNFLYGRFDELMAPPRDTTLLNVFPGSGGNGKLSMEGKTAAAGVDRRLDDCEKAPTPTTVSPTKAPTPTTVSPTKAPCVELAQLPGLSETAGADWNAVIEADTSCVTSFKDLFKSNAGFNGNLNDWDTSKVIDMGYTLSASAFNGNVAAWDTSKATNMGWVFYRAAKFNGNVEAWDVSPLLDMSGTFSGATKFNGNLNDWDTSKVINMEYTFFEPTASKFNGNLTDWDTSKVINMGYTFNGASKFDGNLTAWDVEEVTSYVNFCGNHCGSFSGVPKWPI